MAPTKERRQQRIEWLEQGLKRCFCCGQIKPLDEFNKSKSEKDGHVKICRECSKARDKERNKDGPRNAARREREELAAQGLKRCTKCGLIKPLSEFGKKSSRPEGTDRWCRDCNREMHENYRDNPENVARERASHLLWIANNYDEYLAGVRQYAKEHKEQNSVRRRQWHIDHKDSENAKARVRVPIWAKNNPDKVAVHRYNTRHKRAGLISKMPGSFTDEQFEELIQLCGGHCVLYCPECDEEKGLTRDHIIPLTWEGSTNYIANIQPMCRWHNAKKGKLEAVDRRPEPAMMWAWQETIRQINKERGDQGE